MGFFNRLCRVASDIIGSSWAFILAFLSIIIWLVSGPFFNYSDTWQLIINTTTTIVTFLIVFLLQHTQNRDTKTLQLKMDELIVKIDEASNERIALDELSDEELDALEERYKKLAKKRSKGKES